MKGRRWTKEEDRLLVDTVLRRIREGGSQLDAFAEVGKKLGRTPGACGFRWNAVLRRKETAAFQEAKRQRVAKQLKKRQSAEPFHFRDILSFLQKHEEEWKRTRLRVEELERKRKEQEQELARLMAERERLVQPVFGGDSMNRLLEKYQQLLKMMQVLRPMDSLESETGERSTIPADTTEADSLLDKTSVDAKSDSHS
jgi:RsfA family transcription factor